MAPELFSSKHGHSKRTMLESYLNINNLRQVQAAYDPRQSPFTLQLQLLIKAQKGVVVDCEALGRDSHVVSKHLFLWANEQSEERLQDVGDRLAFLAYQAGDLQQKHASSLERARGDLKELRNMENDLTKTREREKALGVQLGKLRQENRPKPETVEKLAAASAEHSAIEQELRRSEAALSQHKRRLLRSSYQTQFEAMRELGEKLSIISGYGSLLLDELNDDSPMRYDGKDRTAWIKMAAASSLAEYKGPIIERPSVGQPPVGVGLSPGSESAGSFHPPYSPESHISQCVSGSSTAPSSSHYDSHQHSEASLSCTHPTTSLHSDVGSMSDSHSVSHQPASPPPPGSQPSMLYTRPLGSGQSEYASGPFISLPSGGASARPTAAASAQSSVTATGGRVPMGANSPTVATHPNHPPDDCPEPKDDDVPPAYTAVPEAR